MHRDPLHLGDLAAATVGYVRVVDIHLMRHGQSTWNVEGRLQGQTAHPSLTATGRMDAARAADRLIELIGRDPAALITSDLCRATQTAAIIATTLQLPGPPSTSAALREQHLGDLQGRLTTELRAEPVPDGAHISEVRWGGGESLLDVHQRLRRFFDALLPSAPRHVIAVTHGDTLRVARALLQGRSHREVEWSPIANGAVVTVAVRVAGGTWQPS